MKKVVSLVLLLALVASLLAYPVTVVDDLGRVVVIDKAPERVVSVSPAATRYLIYLGLEDKVVGVTDWDPLRSKDVESVGNMVPLNIEKILSLKPDLVLSFGGFQAGEVPKLEKVGIKVLAINPLSLNDIIRELRIIGVVFGEDQKAKEEADKLNKMMMDVALKAYKVPLEKRPKVLYLSGAPDANMKEFWVPVAGSYLNDLITLAGGRNITANLSGPNGWAPISAEYIVSQKPDVIIVATFVPGSDDKVIEAVKNFEHFKDLPAVKNERIYVVDGNLASQPSPQIFELLKKVYGFLYEK